MIAKSAIEAATARVLSPRIGRLLPVGNDDAVRISKLVPTAFS